MEARPRPSTLWASLDDFDNEGGWDETEEEADSFYKEVEGQIQDKLEEMGKGRVQALDTKEAVVSTAGEPVMGATQAIDERCEEPRNRSDRSVSPKKPSESSFPPPSFHTSQIIDTSTPRSLRSVTLPTLTTPNIDTPPALRPLRQATTPAVTARPSRRMSTSTPTNIPSPSNTPIARPTASTSSVGEGKGKRDDPATPIPLGSGGLAKLKGKKDYQTLTDHFRRFEMGVAKQDLANDGGVKGKGKSKARMVKAPKTAGLGGKVLSGFRFCIPPELNNVGKHKRWWAIISELGGQVTITPDTATTHVISENRTASELIKELGLNTLSELPEGAACVKWNFVAQCKLTGTVLDVSPFLSFPRNAFSKLPCIRPQRTASRLADITSQLKGPSISISKKREHTASDSETGSPQNPKRPPSDLQMIKPPTPKKKKSNPWYAPGDVADIPTVDTNHALATGIGWKEGAKGEWDALDEMISGVQAGTAEDEDDDEDDGDDSITACQDEQDYNLCLLGDQFKCGQKNDGIQLKGPNEWLAKKFEEMYDMYEGMQGKSSFSVRQYRQAAGIMRWIEFAITSSAQVRHVKGIGQSIADRIDEFIKGGPGRLYYESNEQMQTVQLFKDIYGVGKIFANQLYARGARTIDDLRTKDYGLTAGQRIGLDLYDDLKTRIPRAECLQIFEIVRDEARILDPSLWIEIMGSYRRGAETSGDIDMLITRDTADGKDHAGMLPRLVRRLKEMGIITHDLSMPHDWNALEAKWMGVGRLSIEGKYRRIDILCIPFKQWGAALIYFTGNDIFNRSLRLYARKKGYSLNQRGLSRGVIRGQDGMKLTEGEIVASRTEEEIFGMLGLRWSRNIVAHDDYDFLNPCDL